jgi:hypothetical protein
MECRERRAIVRRLFPTGHLGNENPTVDRRPSTIGRVVGWSGGHQVADLATVGRS